VGSDAGVPGFAGSFVAIKPTSFPETGAAAGPDVLGETAAGEGVAPPDVDDGGTAGSDDLTCGVPG
jgi:hypothetical protein